MSESKAGPAGTPEPITRRDFIDGVLKGSGAALLLAGAPTLLGAKSPSGIPHAVLDASWTGPGGIGDYAHANGNTHTTVNAAHAIRDGLYDLASLPAPDEDYDLVIIGSGISGLYSAFRTLKDAGPKVKVLILDNNAIFGGEAKQNDVEVEGYRLQAPQGSNMCIWPPKIAEKIGFFWHDAWRELGLPMGDEPDAPTWVDYPKMPAPKNHYSAMMVVRDRWPQAQFFRDPAHPGKWIHAMNPWKNGYRDLPWSDEARQQLARVDQYVLAAPDGEEALERWMDSLTYREFLIQKVGVTHEEVFAYLDPQIAAYGTGMGCDTISALAARTFRAPATMTAEEIARDQNRRKKPELDFEPVSFPGGNGAIARYLVKRLTPEAIGGGDSLADILYGPVNWAALDRPGAPVRIRSNSTAIDVRHDGPVDTSRNVLVTYVDNVTGKKRRVRAKTVIMASGQWVNKHIARDAPQPVLAAMDRFNHAPMLIVNVAIRNWECLEKLGAPAVRWFDSFGWFTNVRAPMSFKGQHMPIEPGKPTVLSFYIPYSTFAPKEIRGLPVRAQCILARTELYKLSFRDIESRIRTQLRETLTPFGFDDSKDIAAIISNRWGHAYVTPEPGFYRGQNGQPSPREIVQQGYGRIRFGHSELSGEQLWPHACAEGERAARQIRQFIS